MKQTVRLEGELLKQVQQTELSILKEVAAFCEEKNINYCITSGTLLGAVRHNGFIPWDDDIDISMPRADYERFLAYANDFIDGYEIVSTKLNNQYPIAIAKVRKSGTVMKEPSMAHLDINHGVWIDIFPLDKVKNVDKLKHRAHIFNLLTTVINYKLKISIPTKIKTKLICMFLGLFSVKTLDKIRTKVMTSEEKTDAKKYTSFASNLGPSKLLFDEDVYFPFEKIKFEDNFFFAPAKSEVWLKSAYGDYVMLPPEHERVNRHKIVEIKV